MAAEQDEFLGYTSRVDQTNLVQACKMVVYPIRSVDLSILNYFGIIDRLMHLVRDVNLTAFVTYAENHVPTYVELMCDFYTSFNFKYIVKF